MTNAEERITKVEAAMATMATQNRRMKALVCLAAMLGLLPYVLGAWGGGAQQKVIRAESFEVVQGKKVVARLYSTGSGGSLSISNKDQKVAATLMAAPDGGRLAIASKDGNMAAFLAGRADGGILATWNKDAKPAATLSAIPGGGVMTLFGDGGGIRFRAP